MKQFLTAALATLAICAQAQVLTTAPKQSYSGIAGGADTAVLPQRNWIEAESACARGLPHKMPPMFLTIESNGCLVELTKEQAAQMLKISSMPDSMQPRKQKLRLSSIEVDTLHFDTLPVPINQRIGDALGAPFIISDGGLEHVDVHPVYKTLPYEVKPTTAQSKNLFFAPYETIHHGDETPPHPCEWVHNTAFDDGVPLRQYRICRMCLRYESRGVRVTSEGGEFWDLLKRLDLGNKKH